MHTVDSSLDISQQYISSYLVRLIDSYLDSKIGHLFLIITCSGEPKESWRSGTLDLLK